MIKINEEILKEFYKEFEILKLYVTEIDFGDLDINMREVVTQTEKEMLDNYFEDSNDESIEDFMNMVTRRYPPITADIILDIENIILNHNYCLLGYKKENNFYTILSPLNDCGVDEAYFRICVIQKSKEDCILKVAIKIKNEIKAEIQNLFKGE